jgi:hypothetical protein
MAFLTFVLELSIACWLVAIVSAEESGLATAANDSAKTISAGAAKADITPPLPASYDLLQVANEVVHPLHARVLYLEDRDDQVIVVATDYEGILRTAYEMLRAAISKETGVPTHRIVVNANHSHNSPWINVDMEDLLAPHGIHQVDTNYFREAVAKIAQAARRAKENKKSVTLSVASARLPELCWNRRNGYVKTEDVDRFNQKRRYPIGVTDPTLGLMRFDSQDGKPVAVLCIYASHYTGAGPDKISSSYSGPAMRNIEQELGNGSVSLFLQGCAGNIVPPRDLLDGSAEAVEQAGELLSRQALPVLRSGMKRIDKGEFSFGSRRVGLPLAPLREHGPLEYVKTMFAKPAVNASAKYKPLTLAELKSKFYEALNLYKERVRLGETDDVYSYVLNLTAYGDRLTLAQNLEPWSHYDFQALTAGPLCLVFLPGELFIEIALEIRDRAGFDYTFVAAYNDLTPVYVPNETAFEEGGYEVGPWCYSTPDTANVIVREALDLIRSLK